MHKYYYGGGVLVLISGTLSGVEIPDIRLFCLRLNCHMAYQKERKGAGQLQQF